MAIVPCSPRDTYPYLWSGKEPNDIFRACGEKTLPQRKPELHPAKPQAPALRITQALKKTTSVETATV